MEKAKDVHMMSVYTIAKCFQLIEEIFGPGGKWFPINDVQRELLSTYQKCKEELGGFTVEELEGIASENYLEINSFLEKRGFSIRLAEPKHLHDHPFSVAATLQVTAGWDYNNWDVGEKSITTEGDKKIAGTWIRYPRHFNLAGCPEVISELKLKNGDLLYLLPEYDGIDISGIVNKFQTMKTEDYEFSDVVFPQVVYQQSEDLEDLLGLAYREMDWIIEQAKQEKIFKMDELGVEIKQASTFQGYSGSQTKPFRIINRPFFVWVRRLNMTHPYFVAKIDEKDWRSPSMNDNQGSRFSNIYGEMYA